MSTQIVVIVLLIGFILMSGYQQIKLGEQDELISDLKGKVQQKTSLNTSLIRTIHELRTDNQKLMDTNYEIKMMEITFYAPLDPNAKEGMCFSGDPRFTASGKKVAIGTTAAADKSIPFGTRIWIDGFGWRTVEDRGGSIKGERIDIAVSSVEEALKLGRQRRMVLILKGAK